MKLGCMEMLTERRQSEPVSCYLLRLTMFMGRTCSTSSMADCHVADITARALIPGQRDGEVTGLDADCGHLFLYGFPAVSCCPQGRPYARRPSERRLDWLSFRNYAFNPGDVFWCETPGC